MKKKLILPTITLLLCTSSAFAQQDKEDLRRAIESLKAAVNQLQVAVAELERAVVNPAPAPIVGRPPSEQPFAQRQGGLGLNDVVVVGSDNYYHREGCAKIRLPSTRMAHSRAHIAYFTCTTCKPDGDDSPSYPTTLSVTPVAQPAAKAPATRSSPSSGRCQATTKKGAQCLRSAQAGRAYCWQHP